MSFFVVPGRTPCSYQTSLGCLGSTLCSLHIPETVSERQVFDTSSTNSSINERKLEPLSKLDIRSCFVISMLHASSSACLPEAMAPMHSFILPERNSTPSPARYRTLLGSLPQPSTHQLGVQSTPSRILVAPAIIVTGPDGITQPTVSPSASNHVREPCIHSSPNQNATDDHLIDEDGEDEHIRRWRQLTGAAADFAITQPDNIDWGIEYLASEKQECVDESAYGSGRSKEKPRRNFFRKRFGRRGSGARLVRRGEPRFEMLN